MTKSRQAGKRGGSLAALALSLDTRKRALPTGAPAVKDGLRDALRAKPAALPAARASAAKAPRVAVAVKAPGGERSAPGARDAMKAPGGRSAPVTSAKSGSVMASAARASSPRRGDSPTASRTQAGDRRPMLSPPAPVPRGVSAVGSVTSRGPALASLARGPSVAPGRTPSAAKGTPPLADSRRRYPRAELNVKARLSLADDPSRVFEASLPTVNISVGGLFLESSFFLKPGTRLLVHLALPPKGREVTVKGEVVRVDTKGDGPSGFALRFTDYVDGSEVVLATHFLSPVLREFISEYAKQHRFDASPEYLAHTADVLAAWELKKAELGADVWQMTGR